MTNWQRSTRAYLTCLLGLVFILVACSPEIQESESTAIIDSSQTETLDLPIEDLVVYVPAGRFLMGSDTELDPLAEEDELPQHSVLLDGYFIYRNEVTNGQYKQCVEAGNCSNPTVFEDGPTTHYNDPSYDNYPVVGVDWYQASAFCSFAESRLPTEAEWEKAARGELGYIYPWGNEQPSCDLSNMVGCTEDSAETILVGQKPDGESFYEANDLSGNAWEWTADWYAQAYYLDSPGTNPLGPEDGQLRVARGGSYKDGPDALRSAERMALDPALAYNNVGFRCVPTGLENEGFVTPPFCQQAYVPFCRDPLKDPNDDCAPLPVGEAAPTTDPDFAVASLTCPSSGYMTFKVRAGDANPEDYVTTLGGSIFDCRKSTLDPNIWNCIGRAAEQGTLTTIAVCPALDSRINPGLVPFGSVETSNALVAYQPAQRTAIAAYAMQQAPAPSLITYQAANPGTGLQAFEPLTETTGLLAYQNGDTYCPRGYEYNLETQQCERTGQVLEIDNTPLQAACPEGWDYNAANRTCELGDSGCPEGTTLLEDGSGCGPASGQECPTGYVFDAETNTCAPPVTGDGGSSCPAGYFFDSSINCCSAINAGELNCEPGFYRSVETNECEPYDENGCPAGTVYNRYEGGCVREPSQLRTPMEEACRAAGQCPPEELDLATCEEGFTYEPFSGQCLPVDLVETFADVAETFTCREGFTYEPISGECLQLPEGGCGPGYRLNPITQSCIPTDGPGSGCAVGYYFNESLNCCTPTPGRGGNYCPGDAIDGQNGALVPFPTETDFDHGVGYCAPGPHGCPIGYFYEPASGQCFLAEEALAFGAEQPSCPDGSSYDESVALCVIDDGGWTCPEGSVLDETLLTCLPTGNRNQDNCPEGSYFDQALGLCISGENGLQEACPDGTYFDTELGFCVQTSCGCQLGFVLDSQTQTCIPENDPDQGCWIVTQSVPVCAAPTPTTDLRCPKPNTHWDEDTESCQSNADDNGATDCASYGSAGACTSAGCTWNTPATAAPYCST